MSKGKHCCTGKYIAVNAHDGLVNANISTNTLQFAGISILIATPTETDKSLHISVNATQFKVLFEAMNMFMNESGWNEDD